MPLTQPLDRAPAALQPRRIEPTDVLVLPRWRSLVTQYAVSDAGEVELRLFYDRREIVFDEPEFFGFGEALGRQAHFVAGDAAAWGQGCDWMRLRDRLETLVDEGVLRFGNADDLGADDGPTPGDRPAPLAPGPASVARDWRDCEAVTEGMNGRPLPVGHLERVVPIFRIAHCAMDADGRQVGEANVFPPAMRLDVPTRWRTCIYAGTRHQDERPMNVTALKAMRAHWGPMMVVLREARAAYLRRFPDAASGWTVGHLERLSTAVLALPTWLLMRADAPLAGGALHPALSSVFRVTDGLRMTMHQMLFIPVGEPTRSPDDPMTSAEAHAYAERNYSFHSEHGVCAGPQAMVEEFLNVLVDGQAPKAGWPTDLHPDVEAAIGEIEPALDYALLGLQAYGAMFSVWPAMTRTYEQLHDLTASWSGEAAAGLHARWQRHLDRMRRSTYLGDESWRVDRENVYADMYARCGEGLGRREAPLADHLATGPAPEPVSGAVAAAIARALGPAPVERLGDLTDCVTAFLLRTQAIIRLGDEIQARVNRHLGREAPWRAFDSRDIDLHNQMQGAAERRLPYLLDELREVFGLDIVIDADRIEVTDLGEGG